tara:strand:- start:880 stop:1386 length:507 start_codon:yes stop_codon:yes gene_type:complete
MEDLNLLNGDEENEVKQHEANQPLLSSTGSSSSGQYNIANQTYQRQSTRVNNPVSKKDMLLFIESKKNKVDDMSKDVKSLILKGTTNLKGLIKICDDCLKSLFGRKYGDTVIDIRNIRANCAGLNPVINYLCELEVIWKDIDDNKPVDGGSCLVELFNYINNKIENDA